jgi:hypothetical protein
MDNQTALAWGGILAPLVGAMAVMLAAVAVWIRGKAQLDAFDLAEKQRAKAAAEKILADQKQADKDTAAAKEVAAKAATASAQVVKSAQMAATKVEEVKQALEDHNELVQQRNEATDAKLEALKDTTLATQETGQMTHALVNSAFGTQLKLHAVTARRLAEITKDPADVEAANAAEQLLMEHQQKQANADANSPIR